MCLVPQVPTHICMYVFDLPIHLYIRHLRNYRRRGCFTKHQPAGCIIHNYHWNVALFLMMYIYAVHVPLQSLKNKYNYSREICVVVESRVFLFRNRSFIVNYNYFPEFKCFYVVFRLRIYII